MRHLCLLEFIIYADDLRTSDLGLELRILFLKGSCNKHIEVSSFENSKIIHKKEGGPYCAISDTESSSFNRMTLQVSGVGIALIERTVMPEDPSRENWSVQAYFTILFFDAFSQAFCECVLIISIVSLFGLRLYVPVNNFSVMSGRKFL